MDDKIYEIVKELEKHTKVETMTSGEVVEFIDRLDFYKITQELVKNLTIPDVSVNEVELCFNCGQVPAVNKHTSLCKECYNNWNSGKTIKTN